jgi:hypothetical protein
LIAKAALAATVGRTAVRMLAGLRHELLHAVLQRGFGDPELPAGPVIGAPGEQPCTISVALDPKPVAVIFYFVDPYRPERDCACCDAKFERSECGGD